jgi:anti-sigma regulatory factor (Ser/Thr protein kinase)
MAVDTMSIYAHHTSSDTDSRLFILLGSLRLALSPGNVALARRFTRMVLESAGNSANVLEDVEVIVSELFTNVVLHVDKEGTEPGALVAFARLGTMLRIEVHDSGRPMALPDEPDVVNEHGRGLWIVGALAERWDVETTPSGKCVWAEIEAWPETAASAEA